MRYIISLVLTKSYIPCRFSISQKSIKLLLSLIFSLFLINWHNQIWPFIIIRFSWYWLLLFSFFKKIVFLFLGHTYSMWKSQARDQTHATVATQAAAVTVPGLSPAVPWENSLLCFFHIRNLQGTLGRWGLCVSPLFDFT